MGHRLTKIYTRTGDHGETGLADGRRIAKDAARIEAMGAVDELNSVIGLLLCEDMPDTLRTCLTDAQHDLFDLGGELSVPGHALLTPGHITRLESALEQHNAQLPALKNFVLPGGSRAAGIAHVARTVCRRAERRVITLARNDKAPPLACPYLNRLSDLLFVIARALNRHAKIDDVLWQQGRKR